MSPIITLIFPQIVLTAWACFALIASTVCQAAQKWIGAIGVVICLGLSLIAFLGYPVNGYLLEGGYSMDALTRFGLVLLLAHAAIYWVLAKPSLVEQGFKEAESYVLILMSYVGMTLMVGSKNLLLTYMGIELMSLPLYGLVVMISTPQTIEAAVKYFLTGALASGLLLYGMSLVFAASGTLDYGQWASLQSSPIMSSSSQTLVMAIGVVLMAAGLLFKLGTAPFHMWVPDVYEGAPTPITAFISSAPKVATVIVLMRLSYDALPVMGDQWKNVFLLSALASIILGNILAFRQENIKRLLAYSSISHMGFILLALWAFSHMGMMSALFYASVYLVLSTASFMLIQWIKVGKKELIKIQDLAGFNQGNELGSGLMLIIMFALMGLPPLAGFMSKLMVFQSVFASGGWVFALLAILMTVIGAAYYLKVIRYAYFEGHVSSAIFKVTTSPAYAMMVLLIVFTVLVGLFPGGLMEWCRLAAVKI